MQPVIAVVFAFLSASGFLLAQAPGVSDQFAAPQPVNRPWNVRDHISLAQFVIQSHRGAGELAPENTLEVFELGWSLGTYPEADLRTTKDGVIVAFHDENFSRVVRGIGPEMKKLGVADITFAELSRLDVGAWKGGTEETKRQQLERLRAVKFDGLTQLQVHVRFPGDAKDVQPGEPFSPSRAFLSELSHELAARGILFQTLPYGATNAATYWQLLDLGLASLATDHPQVTRQAVRDYYAKPKP